MLSRKQIKSINSALCWHQTRHAIQTLVSLIIKVNFVKHKLRFTTWKMI